MLTSVELQASDLAHDIVLGKRVKDHANKAKEHWQLLSKQTNHIGNRPNMELLWTYRYHVSNLKHSSLEKSAVRQNKVYKNVEKNANHWSNLTFSENISIHKNKVINEILKGAGVCKQRGSSDHRRKKNIEGHRVPPYKKTITKTGDISVQKDKKRSRC